MKRITILIILVLILISSIFIYKYMNTFSYITSEEAKEIAMNDVSNKDNEYTFNSVTYEKTNTTYVYTLEFTDKVNYYIYKIDAKTSKIIYNKKEAITNNDVYLDEEEILKIVFNHANLKQTACNLISNDITLEDSTPMYNTVFYYNNVKYTYKTNAYTGAIISVVKLDEN